MMIDARREKCPRCAEVKDRTAEHFYLDARGKITGYCRPCQKAYLRAHGRDARTRPRLVAGHRVAARESYRLRHRVPPARYKRLYPVRLDFAAASQPVPGVCW